MAIVTTLATVPVLRRTAPAAWAPLDETGYGGPWARGRPAG
jgi:hypothetical protein